MAYQQLWVCNANSLYTYILNRYDWVGFYGISTIVNYLMQYPLYTYIKYIWYVLVEFYNISNFVGHLMLNYFFYIYLFNIYDLV